MQEISKAVQEGASAYLKRQYTIIGGVAVVLAVVLAIALDIRAAIGFLIGGTFSAAAGFIGMNVSVRANARVAESARGGISPALAIAFKGGAVTGMLVAGPPPPRRAPPFRHPPGVHRGPKEGGGA